MMDVQTAPPTYTPIGGARPPVGNPPMLGQQVPGMSGGLPAQGGLSVTANPMAQSLQSQTPDTQAQQLQSYGRGDDSMLVHMTPNEVNSLQGLALATGGSLTINPDTGLPEAGWLGKLLPTILGAALAATGVGAPLAAGIVGAGQFARTGSLKKGLMAGLGAFGGAGMAGMAGLGGSISHNAAGLLSKNPGFFGANMGLGSIAPAVPVAVTPDTLSNLANTPVTPTVDIPASGIAGGPGATTLGAPAAAAPTAVNPVVDAPKAFAELMYGGGPPAPIKGAQFTGGLGSRFGQAVRTGLPEGTPSFLAKRAPMIAGLGALSNISDASQPKLNKYDPDKDKEDDWNYEGPYRTMPRRFDPTVEGEGEIQFFDEVNPIGYLTASGERRGYAEGGYIDDPNNPLDDLGFDRSDYAKTFDAKLAALKAAGAADTDFAKTITSGLQGALGNQKLHRGQFQTLFSNDIAALDDLIARGKPTTPTATDDFTRRPYDKVFDGGGGGGGVKPPEDKVTVTDTLKTTIDPTKGVVTPGTGTGATLTDRPDIPGATYDSPGVQTLKDLYTPKFTQKDDFVTEKRDPYTMGSELSAKLPEATARYQTSPGAITASRTYAGGSPSERIRAAAQANAAARAAAAAAAAAGTTTPSTTTPAPTTPGTGGELDFGMPKTTSTVGPANTAGPASDRGYTGFDGLAGLGGNNPYMNIYNQQANQQPNQQPNLNAGNVMDTGNVGGEMDFGFGFGPPAQGQTNPNVNLASLIGTDAFFEELSKRYGGGGGNAEYGMPRNQELARGGPVNMHNGAFVVDARTVSELGNGSSNAGIELLQRLGGQPVRGRGDGVSDSVPARIGGKQEARVARDEVIFQPKAVKRLGGGSAKRGTQKLYAMMEKAHKARKRAGRGQDTKLAKGLV
jgi:hypothetical protein